MIPDGAKNVRIIYQEDYEDVKRIKVGIEVKNKYGKIRVPWEYVGKELIVLIPKKERGGIFGSKKRR